MNLIILPLARLAKYKRLIVEDGWQWAFFGTDSCARERVIKELSENSRYCYAKELQDVSLNHKTDFLDWIADLSKIYNSISWWATNTAYKNPLTSDLFLNYCFLTVVREWVRKGIKKRIIIVENPSLLTAFNMNFGARDVLIIDDKISAAKSLLMAKINSFAGHLLFLLKSFNGVVSYLLFFNYRKRVSEILKKKIDVLFFTYISEGSFLDSNIFRDPYMGKLKDYYEEMGLEIITINVNLTDLTVSVRKMIRQNSEVIPFIHFFRIIDICKVFLKGAPPYLEKKLPAISGLDISSIFRYEGIKEKGVVCSGILRFYAMSNIFKQINKHLRLALYPFENQPWEKMMLLALRRAKVRCKIIGYQHTSVQALCLNYFLGSGEQDIHPQPDFIVSNGKYWEEVLKSSGFSCPIKNGGSLRYRQNQPSRQPENYSSDIKEKENNILVLLNISQAYSLDLIFYLLRKPTIDKRFLLKAHPNMPEEVLRRQVKKIPENFVFINGQMDKWFELVGCCIHVGTTAAVECMMRGLRVFKYLPERIDTDPLLGIGNEDIVTDKDTPAFEKQEYSGTIEDNLIAEPFNEAVWKGFLQ